MAGAYPDSPSRRMAWDADGTQAGYCQQTQLAQPTHGITPPTPYVVLPLASRQDLNNENMYDVLDAGGYVGTWLFVVFPELRDIDGIHWNHYTTVRHWSYASADTTNGQDGTWADLSYLGEMRDMRFASFRDSINPFSLTSHLGFRCYQYQTGGSTSSDMRTLHFYGTMTAGETPDRLLFLDTSAADAEFVKPIDQGDVHRGQEVIRTFKLKNNSSTKSINTVQVTAEDLAGTSGDWYTFSKDGVAYQATLNTIGNIAAGGTQLVYAKMEVSDTDMPGLQIARIKANHATVT